MSAVREWPMHVEHAACGRSDGLSMCGECLGVWCDSCDPSHGPLCPWCAGRGYSTAAVAAPIYRQANHVRNNGGEPVQVGEAFSPSRYICKRCGSASPVGIGYASERLEHPDPDPECPGPHLG